MCTIVPNDPNIPRCSMAAQQYIGCEGAITELGVDYVPRHLLKMSDGAEMYVAAHCLRKKEPPKREQMSTWDDVIVWHPKETTHV